jgi:hypothetical protein
MPLPFQMLSSRLGVQSISRRPFVGVQSISRVAIISSSTDLELP